MTAPEPAARVRVEKPILFSAPMVRAILDGRKTQTRRILKPQPPARTACIEPHETYRNEFVPWKGGEPCASIITRWSPGDRLWVRETVRADEHPEEDIIGVRYLADDFFQPLPNTDDAVDNHFRLRCYNSTDPDLDAYKKVPAIHMPRWASRITLEVTDVRVERLQDINQGDALAEGVMEATEVPYIGSMTADMARHAYALLWDHINGAGSWDTNPWVVALTFRRVGGAD